MSEIRLRIIWFLQDIVVRSKQWISIILYRKYWMNENCGFPDLWDGDCWYAVRNIKTDCCLYINTSGQFARLSRPYRRFPKCLKIKKFLVNPYSVNYSTKSGVA